jgi:hypothetical protein
MRGSVVNCIDLSLCDQEAKLPMQMLQFPESILLIVGIISKKKVVNESVNCLYIRKNGYGCK